MFTYYVQFFLGTRDAKYTGHRLCPPGVETLVGLTHGVWGLSEVSTEALSRLK